jgi:hypothetical protein
LDQVCIGWEEKEEVEFGCLPECNPVPVMEAILLFYFFEFEILFIAVAINPLWTNILLYLKSNAK